MGSSERKVHLEVLKSFIRKWRPRKPKNAGREKSQEEDAVEGTLKVSFTLHFTELVTIKTEVIFSLFYSCSQTLTFLP